jgi:hypothetical protein
MRPNASIHEVIASLAIRQSAVSVQYNDHPEAAIHGRLIATAPNEYRVEHQDLIFSSLRDVIAVADGNRIILLEKGAY